MTDLEIRDRAGAVSLSQDIQEVCRRVELVGATADEAYLIRGDATSQGFPRSGARLFAHQFADGSERVVLDNLDRLGGSVDDLNLDAGLAAAMLGSDGQGCLLVVLSLADGSVVADAPVLRPPTVKGQYEGSVVADAPVLRPPTVKGQYEGSVVADAPVLRPPTVKGQYAYCDAGLLSLDGQLAAVATSLLTCDGPESMREGSVLVLDLATGAVLVEDHLYHDAFGVSGLPKSTAGLAWFDTETVAAAVLELPDAPTRIYVGEVVRLVTVRVP